MCLLVHVFPVTRRETFLEISMRVRNTPVYIYFSVHTENVRMHVYTYTRCATDFVRRTTNITNATLVPKQKKKKKQRKQKQKKKPSVNTYTFRGRNSNNANERWIFTDEYLLIRLALFRIVLSLNFTWNASVWIFGRERLYTRTHTRRSDNRETNNRKQAA